MKPEQLRNRILLADMAWIPIALEAEQALRSAFYRNQTTLAANGFVVYLVCALVTWILLSESLRLDGFRGGWRLPSVVSHLLLAVALLTVVLLAVDNVSGRYVGRRALSVLAALLLSGFLTTRLIALRLVLRRYHNGDVNRVVILGSDRLATELAGKFIQHPELMCKVVGFLSAQTDIPAARRAAGAIPITVSTVDVADLLRKQNVHELILAQTPASHEILNLVAFCRQQSIRISLIPQPYELYLSRPRLVDLGGLPLLQLGDMSPRTSARIGKRLLDLAAGSLLAGLTLPIILIACVALRLSTGRALRWETRTGWKGRQFSMLRLNVAREPERRSGFQWLLWQLSISELPQFWNVLRGEMSLVGPRPEGPERADRYSPWQEQRLAAKPGMTGLAQVHGLREQHPSDDKTRHDLQYMLRPSMLRDLSLLIETIWTLAIRLVRIPKLTSNIDAADVSELATQPVSYSPQPFQEMLQNAYRAQSGSD